MILKLINKFIRWWRKDPEKLIKKLEWKYPINQNGDTGTLYYKRNGNDITITSLSFASNKNHPKLTLNNKNVNIINQISNMGFSLVFIYDNYKEVDLRELQVFKN